MKSEPSDFPAAHSMDCTWFAVDRDGCVAEFFSGESGAVPSGAASDHTGVSLEAVAAALPETVSLIDPAPGRQPAVFAQDAHRSFWNEAEAQIDDVLMVLSGLEPVAELVARGEAQPVPAVEGFGVVCRALPRALFEQLHAEGCCLHCTYGYYPEAGADPKEPGLSPARRGLFSYVHPGLGLLAQAYARSSQPHEPATLGELPEAVRSAVGRIRFTTLSFRETPYLQPVELVPECFAWGSAYLNTEGTILRAIPGDEEAFLDRLDELREDYPDYTIHPPSPDRRSKSNGV